MKIRTLQSVLIATAIFSVVSCTETTPLNHPISHRESPKILSDNMKFEILSEILIATEEEEYKKVFELTKNLAGYGGMKEQYLLGSMYRKGVGTEVDEGKAYQWYMRSAKQKYPKAIHAIGTMYYMGVGIPQDYIKAMQWYRQAAELKYVKSEYNIGVMYFEGHGVDRSYKKALNWFLIAGNKQYADAQYHIGNMYLRGMGVEMNYNIAIGWYEKAAVNGSLLASKLLEKYK